MNRRVLASLVTAGTMALVAMASLPLSGQSGTPALVITAYNGGPAAPYTVPKTPWRRRFAGPATSGPGWSCRPPPSSSTSCWHPS